MSATANTRILITGIVLAATILAACSQSNDTTSPHYRSEGLITGVDARRCVSPCCGGWFITIDNTQYRFLSLPEGSTLDLNRTELNDFPIPVLLDWEAAPEQCAQDKIIVTAIQRK